MRELSIVELNLIVGGYGGGYDYGSSYLVDDGSNSGIYAGVVYEADAQVMQAQATSQNIEWGVEGNVGNGGWGVKAKVGGKS